MDQPRAFLRRDSPSRVLVPLLVAGAALAPLCAAVAAGCGRTAAVVGVDASPGDASVGDSAIPDATDATPTDASGDSADGGEGEDSAAAADAAAPNRIFVTSTVYPNGDLGGISGADLKCQALGGPTFIAYLSTSTASAASRLGSARGWVRMDGRPVADTATDLAHGNLWYPVSIDESGQPATLPAAVATGTDSMGGARGAYTCGDWTQGGSGSSIGSGCWTAGYAQFEFCAKGPCDTPVHLYCLETTQAVAVAAPASTGRYAFVASKSFDTAAALAGADALCASDAAGVLPGTYRALLATTGASAASRFTLTGAAWSRPDGVSVVATPSDLAIDKLLAPITMTAAGVPIPFDRVWSGSASLGAVGTQTCGDWTLSDAGLGEVGATGFLPDPSFVQNVPCGQVYPSLYCLQE